MTGARSPAVAIRRTASACSSMTGPSVQGFPRRPCWRASVAGTRPRSPSFTRARRSWIWAPAAASTCCCPPKRVGPTGHVFGLDMTDEMLDVARANARAADATNVEFLKGYIEDIPLPAASIDVVISNCVINLSTDKPAVIAEMFRVLRSGGRLGISDVVAADELAPADRAERGSYVGCIAGALSFAEYTAELTSAGFVDVATGRRTRWRSRCSAPSCRPASPDGRPNPARGHQRPATGRWGRNGAFVALTCDGRPTRDPRYDGGADRATHRSTRTALPSRRRMFIRDPVGIHHR